MSEAVEPHPEIVYHWHRMFPLQRLALDLLNLAATRILAFLIQLFMTADVFCTIWKVLLSYCT